MARLYLKILSKSSWIHRISQKIEKRKKQKIQMRIKLNESKLYKLNYDYQFFFERKRDDSRIINAIISFQTIDIISI